MLNSTDKELHKKYPTLADAYEKYEKVKKGLDINVDPDMREAYNAYQSLKAILTTEEK